LTAHEGHDEKQQIEITDLNGADPSNHDDDFGDFAGDDHGAFTEPVCQVTGDTGQQQVGECKAGQSQGKGIRITNLRFGDRNDEPAKHIVIHRSQELSCQQRQKGG